MTARHIGHEAVGTGWLRSQPVRVHVTAHHSTQGELTLGVCLVTDDINDARVALAYALGRADWPEDVAKQIDDAVKDGTYFANLNDGGIILITPDGAFKVVDDGLEP